MTCRGLCRNHPNYVSARKIDYSKGVKVCMSCDRVIFVNLRGHQCPCCNKTLRTKPQYYGQNSKTVKEKTVHRI